MTDTLPDRIWALNDRQTLAAAAALATGLELELNAKGLDTTNFENLVTRGSSKEKKLYEGLKGASETETAAAARAILQLAADLGYVARVETAITASAKHGRDFGIASGPLLVAGLAVVLAYVPVEQRSKVTRIHSRAADGSERTEDVTEIETKRVGATAVAKLADWWKAVLGGSVP
jgi:hypothetical protein